MVVEIPRSCKRTRSLNLSAYSERKLQYCASCQRNTDMEPQEGCRLLWLRGTELVLRGGGNAEPVERARKLSRNRKRVTVLDLAAFEHIDERAVSKERD